MCTVSSDGKSLYVVGGTNVEVIETQTNTAITSIGLGNREVPTEITITPDGGHAYVAGDGGDLWVIDTAKNAIVASIPVATPNPLFGVTFIPDATRAYVTCGNNSAIYVLDAATNRVVDTPYSQYLLESRLLGLQGCRWYGSPKRKGVQS